MPEKMKFDYYYGLDAEQFTFVYQITKNVIYGRAI